MILLVYAYRVQVNGIHEDVVVCRVLSNEVLLERWREVPGPINVTLWQRQLQSRVVLILRKADLVNFHLVGLPVIRILIIPSYVRLVPGQLERTRTYWIAGEILGRVANRGKDVLWNDILFPGNVHQHRGVNLLEGYHDRIGVRCGDIFEEAPNA